MYIRLSSLLLIVIVLAILFLPEVKASTTETLYPNVAGDSSACTPVGGSGPNWDCVDETPYDTTTYVYSPSTDSTPRLDLYNIQASSIPSGSTINSVSVYAVCRSLNPTYKASFRMSLKKSGGSTQYGTPNQPTTTYTLYGSGFTGILQTDLDALQIGIEIESGDHDPIFYSGRCTQVYTVIDYTVVSATWKTVSTWTENLVTRQWTTASTWLESLGAKSWNLISTWTESLLTKGWNIISIWTQNLFARVWNQNAIWTFNLGAEGWFTVSTWNFNLGPLDEDYLIIFAISLFLIMCTLIIYFAFKK